MICNNCDRSIREDNKVCPYCGFVLNKKEISQTEHHNYGKDAEVIKNLRLTDEVLDNYGFSYKSVANALVLFKSKGFYLLNALVFLTYMIVLYLITESLPFTITATLVCFIGKILLELIFYKTNAKWYGAILPIRNILGLFKLYLRDYKAVYNIIYTVWFFSTVWIVALGLVFFLLTGAYFDMVLPIVTFFIELQIYIIALGFIVYIFKTFYCIGYRYGFNPYLVMALPFIYIPRIALSEDLYYHPDKPV